MQAAEQQAFRDSFRTTIPQGYSGIRHGLGTLVLASMAIAGFLALVDGPLTPLDWAMVPLSVLGWNVVEWWVHMKVLHNPRKTAIARALYQRHTHTHHRFYSEAMPELEGTRDLKIVFFPLFALPVTLFLALPAALVAWALFSSNAACLLMATLAVMYLLFEAMHLCAHLPDNAFVRTMPLVALMRRHHIAHHDPARMMRANMNFTLPLMDLLMGTADFGTSTTRARAR